MTPKALCCLLLGLLVLKGGAQGPPGSGGERRGKAGFCAPSPSGLYEPPCDVECEADSECPAEEKCCEFACNYVCRPPCKEKPGSCPPPLMKKLHAPLTCDARCASDADCPGMEKCCGTGCEGWICRPPLEDKPGKCPRKQRTPPAPLAGRAEDACAHDAECPGLEKCCFTGSGMNCVPV